MKIRVKCLVPMPKFKIYVIKLLREAFGLSLKEGKAIADRLDNAESTIVDVTPAPDLDDLNLNCSRLPNQGILLEYHKHDETAMEKLMPRLYAMIWDAVEWNEPRIAEDLLKVYNKHTPKKK